MTATTTRLDIRISNSDKNLLASAAEFSGLSVSAFVLKAAREQAQSVSRQAARLALSQRDFKRILEALDQPPALNRRLKRALDQHTRRVESR